MASLSALTYVCSYSSLICHRYYATAQIQLRKRKARPLPNPLISMVQHV